MFRAYEPEQDRLVAVKLFQLDLPPDLAQLLIVQLEALIAADLAHPAISAPLATGLSGLSPYLAQDFVAADSLDVVVRDSGASPADVARVAQQLGQALDFAAGAHVLHGALHPRDVLMSADDVRITGLGVTRAIERAGVSAPMRRPYTAPERAAGHAWDRTADVFSLAALMFELLCGKRISGFGEQAADAIPSVAGIGRPELKRVFARGLAEHPADRFDSAGAFADALQMAVGEKPTMAPARGRPRHRPVPTPTPTPTQGELALPLDASDAGRADLPADTHVAESARSTPGPSQPPAPADLDLRTLDASTVRVHEWLTFEPAEDVPKAPPGTELPPILESELPVDRIERAPSAVPSILSEGALETTRSAVWPLMLALIVGVAIGFGIAMAFVARNTEQTASVQAPPPATMPDPQPPAPATSVRGSSTQESTAPSSPGAAVMSSPPAAEESPSPRSQNDLDGSARRPTPGSSAAPASRAVPPAPRQEAPAPPARGTLVVRSTPPGAQVFLDGTRAGTTPMTLRDLSRGSHAVRVVRDGYVAVERRVSLTSSRLSQTIAVELERPRATAAPVTPPPASTQAKTGAISVDSRPTGANVFVDGRLVGTTPLVIEAVAIGQHAVRLELATYRPWSSSVTVVAGQRSRVAGSLEQEP